MISLSVPDLIVLIIYAAFLIIIGFLSRKSGVENKIEFLLAGRSLSLPLFVIVSVATWYGGILGVGEFTYRYGINSWFTQGLPYYIFAILFAFLFSKKIRSTNLTTIPEMIEENYGRRIALISSFFVFVIVTPAPYALMVGVILNAFFGFPVWIGILIGLILSSIYLFYAGYRSDIFTDVYQFILMFTGFALLLYFSFDKVGNLSYLKENLPTDFLIPLKNISLGYYIVWFLIGLWTFIDPGFHQRSYAAKNEKVAFWGIIISVSCWFIFDFLTVTNGLYTRAVLPDLEKPVYSYLIYADKILPEFIKGIFFASVLATVISTLNSYIFLSAQTLGNDILRRFLIGKIDDVRLIRIGLAITILLSSILAILIPSVIDLWYTIGSIFIPGLLFPIIGSYYEKFRLNERITYYQIITTTIVVFLFFVLKNSGLFETDIEPMIAGILIGLIFQLSKIFIKEGK